MELTETKAANSTQMKTLRKVTSWRVRRSHRALAGTLHLYILGAPLTQSNTRVIFSFFFNLAGIVRNTSIMKTSKVLITAELRSIVSITVPASPVRAVVEFPGPTPPELTADTVMTYSVKPVRLVVSSV